MWKIVGTEKNMTPDDFQDRLTYVGGENRYSEPNFVLWWGQYAYGPGSFRAGGAWSVDEKPFIGYRDLLRGSGEPCFCLGQWHSPEEYNSPESYYVSNLDETTNLSILGEYPYQGRYELLYNLRSQEIIDGKIQFFTLPLNTRVFDVVAQIVLLAKEITVEKTKAAYLAAKEAEEACKLAEVERHLHDKAIPYSGGVSFTRQGIRSTVIDQKARQMQQRWNQLASSAAKFDKPGLQTR